MRAIIISNGCFNIETLKKHKRPSDLIICADGGADHLYKTDIVPDMIVGDLDSIDEKTMVYYQELNVEFHRFPSKKDNTDTELAIDFALKEDSTELLLLGSTGTRLDHTLGNIMLLYKLLKQGIKARVIDENNEISITDSDMEVEKEEDTFISLIPLTEKCSDISLSGFKYSTDSLNLSLGSTMGISNEVEDEKAHIEIKKGVTLVIKSRDT